jgi:hypothetical protein
MDVIGGRILGRPVKDQDLQILGLQVRNSAGDMAGGYNPRIGYQQNATTLLLNNVSPKLIKGIFTENHPGADREIEWLHSEEASERVSEQGFKRSRILSEVRHAT